MYNTEQVWRQYMYMYMYMYFIAIGTHPIVPSVFPDWLAGTDVQQVHDFVPPPTNNATVVMGTN